MKNKKFIQVDQDKLEEIYRLIVDNNEPIIKLPPHLDKSDISLYVAIAGYDARGKILWQIANMVNDLMQRESIEETNN